MPEHLQTQSQHNAHGQDGGELSSAAAENSGVLKIDSLDHHGSAESTSSSSELLPLTLRRRSTGGGPPAWFSPTKVSLDTRASESDCRLASHRLASPHPFPGAPFMLHRFLGRVIPRVSLWGLLGQRDSRAPAHDQHYICADRVQNLGPWALLPGARDRRTSIPAPVLEPS